jgi:hypothetical protein
MFCIRPRDLVDGFRLGFAAAASMLLAACSPASVTHLVPQYTHGGSSPVSAAELGESWPLTVRQGFVFCFRSESGRTMLVFDTEARSYGLNALGLWEHYRPIGEIRAGNKDLRPLRDYARAICSLAASRHTAGERSKSLP